MTGGQAVTVDLSGPGLTGLSFQLCEPIRFDLGGGRMVTGMVTALRPDGSVQVTLAEPLTIPPTDEETFDA